MSHTMRKPVLYHMRITKGQISLLFLCSLISTIVVCCYFSWCIYNAKTLGSVWVFVDGFESSLVATLWWQFFSCCGSVKKLPWAFSYRRGHTVLKAALPLKEEYVFMVQMSDIQKQLYKKFMDSVQDAAQNGWVNNNPLKAFAVCCKVKFAFLGGLPGPMYLWPTNVHFWHFHCLTRVKYSNDPTFSDKQVWANSVDPDPTGFTLFVIPPASLGPISL